MTQSVGIRWCMLWVCLMLWACGTSDAPAPPSREPALEKDFTIIKSEILSYSSGFIIDSYQIGLTSAQGDYLSFTLHTHCLGMPAGTFVSAPESVSGALTDLHYTQSSALRDSPDKLSLSLIPMSSGTAVSGTLTTTKGTSVAINGSLDLAFPKTNRHLIFPTPSDTGGITDNQEYTFTISDAQSAGEYLLSVKLQEIADGILPIANNPVSLTGRYMTPDNKIAESKIDILTGEMQITITGNVLSGHFQYGNFDVTFTCELPENENPEPDYQELTHILETRQSGSDFISIKLASEGVKMDRDPITWQISYTGIGQFVDLEIYAPDGVLKAGQYSVASSPAPDSFRAGWNPGDTYGIGIEFENWGTCLYRFDTDGMTVSHIKDGIVYVEKTSDTYTLTIVSSLIAARYVGPIPSAAN